MDTVSTLSHIAQGGSGYLWYIVGGIALTLTLTISYKINQSIKSGKNSKNANIGKNVEGDLNMSSNSPRPKPKK